MFNIFKKDKEPQNLKELVSELKKLDKNLSSLKERLDNLENQSRFFIQKVGMVRFNPFEGGGGDQSFSLAILDKHDNGFVVTNLYNNLSEQNRIYAKPIQKGKSSYSLSDEERKAIAEARKIKES